MVEILFTNVGSAIASALASMGCQGAFGYVGDAIERRRQLRGLNQGNHIARAAVTAQIHASLQILNQYAGEAEPTDTQKIKRAQKSLHKLLKRLDKKDVLERTLAPSTDVMEEMSEALGRLRRSGSEASKDAMSELAKHTLNGVCESGGWARPPEKLESLFSDRFDALFSGSIAHLVENNEPLFRIYTLMSNQEKFDAVFEGQRSVLEATESIRDLGQHAQSVQEAATAIAGSAEALKEARKGFIELSGQLGDVEIRINKKIDALVDGLSEIRSGGQVESGDSPVVDEDFETAHLVEEVIWRRDIVAPAVDGEKWSETSAGRLPKVEEKGGGIWTIDKAFWDGDCVLVLAHCSHGGRVQPLYAAPGLSGQAMNPVFKQSVFSRPREIHYAVPVSPSGEGLLAVTATAATLWGYIPFKAAELRVDGTCVIHYAQSKKKVLRNLVRYEGNMADLAERYPECEAIVLSMAPDKRCIVYGGRPRQAIEEANHEYALTLWDVDEFRNVSMKVALDYPKSVGYCSNSKVLWSASNRYFLMYGDGSPRFSVGDRETGDIQTAPKDPERYFWGSAQWHSRRNFYALYTFTTTKEGKRNREKGEHTIREAQLEIRSATEDSPLHIIKLPHTRELNSLSWCPGGRWIATGSRDGTVCVLDLRTGGHRVLYGSGEEIRHVSYSPDGKRLLVQGLGGSQHCQVHDPESLDPVAEFEGDLTPFDYGPWHPSARRFACVSDNKISMWSL